LVSLATGIPIRKDVAMTGELTLRGRVLPVGGLKEKLLAAMRAGMHTAIVPAGNLAELSEIPAFLRQRIKLRPIHTMAEALAIALARPLPQVKWHGTGVDPAARRGHAVKVISQHRNGGAA
jgi:ATP-dependent Lon protease